MPSESRVRKAEWRCRMTVRRPESEVLYQRGFKLDLTHVLVFCCCSMKMALRRSESVEGPLLLLSIIEDVGRAVQTHEPLLSTLRLARAL